MRIHSLENVDKALQFLKEQRVHLENVGSHDIVDGNHRLTLGLVWTIILRFQVTREWPLPSPTTWDLGRRSPPFTHSFFPSNNILICWNPIPGGRDENNDKNNCHDHHHHDNHFVLTLFQTLF